jgi:hypothetical protein
MNFKFLTKKYLTFDDLEMEDDPYLDQTIGCVLYFENNYGVSVVRGPYTYGGADGLYEIAVLGKDGNITYDTEITDDVIGYLSPLEVTRIMKEIQDLPSI